MEIDNIRKANEHAIGEIRKQNAPLLASSVFPLATSKHDSFCSHPPRPIIRIGKLRLWIGMARNEMYRDSKYDLVIDCSDSSYIKPANFLDGTFVTESLQRYVLPYPKVLSMRWLDYGTPPLDIKFWGVLAKQIRNLQNVAVVCGGGHGRSGLASACLLTAMGIKDSLTILRQSYCRKAVETFEQEKYLLRVYEQYQNTRPPKDGFEIFNLEKRVK